MEYKRIETLPKWLIMKQALKDKGYTRWQTQYSWNQPEGFHVGYMKGSKRVEVITHSQEVAEDIINNL